MQKISLSGLPGCGVRVLLEETRKILGLKYSVELLEAVRLRNPFDNAARNGFVSCFYDVSTQINEENIHSLAHPALLACNRSVLDHWVFWNREMRSKTRTPQLMEKHELIRHLVSYWLPSYDRFFLVRLDYPILRERLGAAFGEEYSEADLRELDETYQQIIADLELQVVEIWNNGTIEETAHKLVSALGDCLAAG